MPAPSTPIQPRHIDTTRHLFDAFGNHETEISAGWIVRFCQQRGQGWKPFPLSELQAFYGQRHSHTFRFNRLTPRYVTIEGGMVTVTTQFVAKCYAASPAGS